MLKSKGDRLEKELSLRKRRTRPSTDESTVHSGLHVVLAFLLVELTFLLSGGILVLLVLRDQVVHVRFGLGELHLVHSLASVPVQEGLTAEHRGEVFCHTLEHLLDRRTIACKSDSHFQPLWWNVADARFNIVWNPFNKVGRILVLDVEHLLVHFPGRHPAAE